MYTLIEREITHTYTQVFTTVRMQRHGAPSPKAHTRAQGIAGSVQGKRARHSALYRLHGVRLGVQCLRQAHQQQPQHRHAVAVVRVRLAGLQVQEARTTTPGQDKDDMTWASQTFGTASRPQRRFTDSTASGIQQYMRACICARVQCVCGGGSTIRHGSLPMT